MYTMKQVSEATGLSYETLKFYCNRGLVPGLKRDGGNRRVFEQEDVGEIFCLKRLRSCGMSIEAALAGGGGRGDRPQPGGLLLPGMRRGDRGGAAPADAGAEEAGTVSAD